MIRILIQHKAWLVAITVLLLLQCETLFGGTPSFDSAQLTIGSDQLNTPFEFNITFRPTRMIGVREIIVVRLPRFSRGLLENVTAANITYGDVLISPSYFFLAKFLSGKNTYDNRLDPYTTAELHILPLQNVTFAKQAQYTITVFKENGIGAVCGFPSTQTVNETGMFTYPFKPFEILTAKIDSYPTSMPTAEPSFNTNVPTPDPSAAPSTLTPSSAAPSYTIAPSAVPTTTPVPTLFAPSAAPTIQPIFYRNDSYQFDYFPGLGKGCSGLNACSKQGQCDYCHEKCYCFPGFGSDSDLIQTGRNVQPDCSSRKFISTFLRRFV